MLQNNSLTISAATRWGEGGYSTQTNQ